ncbi:MAG: GNAT family N-acetyltransferase [Candidatus Hermodarchaeota archaeon]|nr:GNAT family N-acetyltransferase [Candidatus Hermodarchaeota archaeon]
MSWQIRPYELSDRPAILEISKRTWGGYDQLPSELDKLMANRNSYMFVMEFKDRVVAFANLKVIDEGKTGWMEFMRVHWRYRKRGFAWTMTQRLITEAQNLGVKRLRLSTTTENEATKRITDRIGMHRLLHMKLFWKGNFRRIRWKDVSVPNVLVSTDEAFVLLTDFPSLVPKGILVDYWHAYDLTKDSLESISENIRFWKGEKNGKDMALSFGYLRVFRGEPMWCSTIYAVGEHSFYSALSQQLQTAVEHEVRGVLCFHPVQYQVGHEIPGLKRNTFSSILVLYEKHPPFDTR